MLFVFPLATFVLLTGGHVRLDGGLVPDWIVPAPALRSFVAYALVSGAILLLVGLFARLSGHPVAGSGRLVAGLLAAIGIVMVTISIDFGLEPVETAKWGGLLVTLVVALTGMVVSLPLAILLALGRRSRMPLVRLASTIFIEVWRGVPLITVLFFATYMLPLFLERSPDAMVRVLVGVSIFSGAYMAETIRGGLQAIPKGQFEGAMALGLNYPRMMSLIVMPQALKLVIPGIVNSFIGLFKDTTLVSIVAIFDLLGGIRAGFTDPQWATPVTLYTGFAFAGIIYFAFCYFMSRYSIFVENRLNTGRRR